MMAGWYPLMFVWPMLWLLSCLLVLGGLGFLVYAGVRRSRAGPAPATASEDAIATLRLRYARGELTREEFRRMREDLDGEYRP